LIERLDEGLRQGRRLTLVSAPAGFGKTTLLSEWGDAGPDDRAELQVAWLSLDEGDNDPLRFWSYVLTALRTIPSYCMSGVGESALSMLQSPQPPPIESVLVELINDIAESAVADPAGTRLQRRTILVLDDLHVITNAQVHEGLAFLLDNLPPPPSGGLYLVIATRSDPPLPLSRLRGRGQLTEVNAAELRFTPQEATAFLNQAMGLDLSPEHVAALEERTEGWIVGLQMAAHALSGALASEAREETQVSEFISAFTGSHRYVLDYLADEVLTREPKEVQAFLLQTSILDRLCGPLCDAVTGRDNGQAMLERLDRANLFVVPLDGERRWYRYHGLFAELLAQRLGKRAGPQGDAQRQRVSLHRRASEWYEDAGLIEEAITHALAGQDYARAGELIEQNAIYQMTSHRQEAALAEWLKALPDELVRSRPWLCVYLAWTRYWTGQRDRVEECLQAAEEGLQGIASSSTGTLDKQDTRLVTGYIAAIRAHHALTNQEIPRVIEMARRAIEYLPEGDYMRCEAAVALGGAFWSQGDVVASQRAFTQAKTTALRSGYPPMAVPSSCYVGEQQFKRGQLQGALATYREALEWATGPSGRLMSVASFPLIKLGDLYREWNDLEAANRDLARGVELCQQLGQADILGEAYVARARLQRAQGDVQGVRDSLQKAEQIAQRVKIDPWIGTWIDECRLWLWLSTGNLVAALAWVQERKLSLDSALSYQHDLHHILLARVLIAQGSADPTGHGMEDALVLLARLLEAAEKAGWVNEQIQIQILRSLALKTSGDAEGALVALGHALTLAEPAGYVRTFVEEGVPMARLLHQAAAQGIMPDYAGRLLAAFEFQVANGDAVRAQVESESPEPGSELIEPLSERETEVLALIAEGLTNREIGQQLCISLGTVKAHTSNVYGKLGVRSRTEAVARSRVLGIL
jgi:LuxR family maltose regulon positive regulatory protein